MKLSLRNAPWYDGSPTAELIEASALLTDGVWQSAASDFYAERAAKESLGQQAPKGVQKYLNAVISTRMESAGWDAYGGRFAKGQTWVRVTFRHQMSLGSDLIDALRAAKRERMEQVAIVAASSEFLAVISPNDQKALVSFEKLAAEVDSLEGCTDIPLVIGRLDEHGGLSKPVSDAVRGPRPRDEYRPAGE